MSNKWFNHTFLPTFDLCKLQPLSPKQGEVFLKNLPLTTRKDKAEIYSKTINGRHIQVTASQEWAGHYNGKAQSKVRYYLTITKPSNNTKPTKIDYVPYRDFETFATCRKEDKRKSIWK